MYKGKPRVKYKADQLVMIRNMAPGSYVVKKDLDNGNLDNQDSGNELRRGRRNVRIGRALVKI